MEEPDDQQFLERARAGDAEALEKLLEQRQAQVYRFGLKMCRDPEDAKDVAQDTLIAMARGVRDFRGASSISTWLYSVARSFCIKKRRKSKFAPEERSLDADAAVEARRLADPSKGPEELLAGRQVERALDEAIGALEPMYREVLLLRDVEGLTAPEVGEVLGLSVQAVKSRLHRARLVVRARLAPLLGMPMEATAAAAVGAATAAANSAASACPDVLTLFSRHLEDEISADVCAELERHVASCARCRGACDSLKRTLALCRTAGNSVEVPSEVQKSVKVALRDFLGENA